MARVELVIGVVGFISGFILKNSPFPSSWFFPEKNLFRKRYGTSKTPNNQLLIWQFSNTEELKKTEITGMFFRSILK